MLKSLLAGVVPDLFIQRGTSGPIKIIETLKTHGEFLKEIPFRTIGFPKAGMQGHEEKLLLFSVPVNSARKIHVLIACGRHHYYQSGNVYEATFAVRTVVALGIKNIILINAAGGFSNDMPTGTVMFIKSGSTDIPSPNIGVGFNKTQFVDPKVLFDASWYSRATLAMQDANVKSGAYFAKAGPEFETDEEARTLFMQGYVAGGMSTIPEALAAKAQDPTTKIIGVSLITNHHFLNPPQQLSEEDVKKMSHQYDEKLSFVLDDLIMTCPE
jgi:purine-nucleoside phosphorylase